MYLASNLFRIDHVTPLAVLPVHDGHLKGSIRLQTVGTLSSHCYHVKLCVHVFTPSSQHSSHVSSSTV